MPFSQYRGGGGSSKWTAPPDPLKKTQRSIDNAKLRIQDAGFKVEDADKRNWFEKATNLPEGQNWFFDTLELLSRPGRAVVNAIDKVPTQDENLGQALWRGFSGQDRITGAEVFEHRGIENPVAKTVLGTGLDILADPITFIPGGAIAKGAKAASKTAALPLKTGYKALERVAPQVKNVRENIVQPAATDVKDRLGYMFNPNYKATETLSGGQSDALVNAFNRSENQRRFLQDEYAKDLTNTAKNTGLEAGTEVGRVMEAPLKQFEDAKAYQLPDGTVTENKTDIFDQIRNKQSEIKNVGTGIRGMQKEYDQAVGEFAKGIDQTDGQITKLFNQIQRLESKGLDKQTRASLREAKTELRRIESQIKGMPKYENSLLNHFKKQIREQHDASFDLAKQVKAAAPNGIKGVDRVDMPNILKNSVRENGKGIDEVASELGYQTADDLIQSLKALNGVPRRLSNSEVESLARQEMERTGALRNLNETKTGLTAAQKTLQGSLKSAGKVNNAAKAEQQAFAKIESDPRYQELTAQRDALKSQKDNILNESKAQRDTRIQQIRQLENEINQLRESAGNPVTIQKEIPRPEREVSTDPKIQQAAQSLINSNQAIRNLARANGINISELEGYMTHVFSKEERARRKAAKPNSIDNKLLGLSQPNKSILKQRKLTGSAEDVNETVGRNIFEPNAYFATAIGQRRLIDYIHAVTFRKQVLNNPDFAIKYEPGMDIPKNATVIDSNNYKFIREGDELEGVANQDIGGKYIVTKAAKEKLDRYKYTATDEGSKAFLRAFDGAQSFWKRAALFSLPYHLRNDVGAKFNNWVGGMNAADMVKYSSQADKEVFNAMIRGKESPMYREYRKQGLGSASQSQVEFMRRGQEPEAAIEKMVTEGSKDLKGKVKDRLNPLRAFETSREFGIFIDQTNRFAAYLWARNKLRLSPEEAAQRVNTMQFDYTNLTNFEQNFMTRIVPFYRWARNNIPYQITRFIHDPRKYINLNKARLNSQSAFGIDDEKLADYMKSNFYFPISGSGGVGKMVGLNLPAGDLTKLSNPLGLTVNSLTPLIKLPLELGTNRNFFFDKPIENFEGEEKKFRVPFTDQTFGIPVKTAYALEQATGQIGRGFSKFIQEPESVNQDTKFRLPTLGISSILKDYDMNKANLYEAWDQLSKLQDYIDYIEQQTGKRPRTVNEIKKGS